MEPNSFYSQDDILRVEREPKGTYTSHQCRVTNNQKKRQSSCSRMGNTGSNSQPKSKYILEPAHKGFDVERIRKIC